MPKILFNLFKKDHHLSLVTATTLVQVVFLTTLFLFFYSQLPNSLPLLYSLPWGDGQLVNKGQFLVVPAIIILITLVNLTLASQLHPSQTFLKKVLLATNVLVTTIFFISALKIIMIFI